MAKKEKTAKEFARRLRIKGTITSISKTKKGNTKLKIKKGDDEFSFIVLKSHKETHVLAETLQKGDKVKAEGISKLRITICTKLKRIQAVDESRQSELESYS